MQLRVISGSARGKRLKVPKGNIRPLSEQAREALFNILAPVVGDSVFLDLFAGSGAVGIEALSRGARLAFFVEIDRKSVPVINENLANTGFTDRAEVFALPADRGIKFLTKKNAKFDIIFLGAPYGSKSLYDCLKLIGDSELLAPSGVVIAEHRFKQTIDPVYGKLIQYRQQRYGDTVFTFYKVEV
ncbi:MAG TPA: 16S rRNA (guanine(966)-N(2))-methyltransferase RsmD [Candidatus Omnitrophota bacterium]|nr:16S rRNA (guanine(966)-N(2))-methyltransferase RsmD [Candidatus Omnitrophota bacterium]